jgi:hypothetical protein
MKNLRILLFSLGFFAATGLMAASSMTAKTVSKTDSTVKSEVLPDDVLAP